MTTDKDTREPSAETTDIEVADKAEVMAALDKIRERDAELLRRLAR